MDVILKVGNGRRKQSLASGIELKIVKRFLPFARNFRFVKIEFETARGWDFIKMGGGVYSIDFFFFWSESFSRTRCISLFFLSRSRKIASLLLQLFLLFFLSFFFPSSFFICQY